MVRAELLKYKARKAELKAGGAKVEKKGELERAEQLVQEQQEETWQEDEEWDENDEGYYDQVGVAGAAVCGSCIDGREYEPWLQCEPWLLGWLMLSI